MTETQVVFTWPSGNSSCLIQEVLQQDSLGFVFFEMLYCKISIHLLVVVRILEIVHSLIFFSSS